jgi:hypothetical protein
LSVTKVQQITTAIQQLSGKERREVQEWLENSLEDELELTADFEAKIERGEQDFREERVSDSKTVS